ncbi:rhodanese-like domain-containing protein [Thermodesulfobacteriota bacterium]
MTIYKKSKILKTVSFIIISSICSVFSCADARSPIYKEIIPEESYELIQKQKGNPEFMIIDVRTPEEFEIEHIMGAVNINIRSESFNDDVKALPRDKIYLIYCRTANRSARAFRIFQELNFHEVYHMLWGIVGWKEDGLPVVSDQ